MKSGGEVCEESPQALILCTVLPDDFYKFSAVHYGKCSDPDKIAVFLRWILAGIIQRSLVKPFLCWIYTVSMCVQAGVVIYTWRCDLAHSFPFFTTNLQHIDMELSHRK